MTLAAIGILLDNILETTCFFAAFAFGGESLSLGAVAGGGLFARSDLVFVEKMERGFAGGN